MKLSNPIKNWRRRGSVEQSPRSVGQHEGYDTSPLPRLTWVGFSMGILVSMGQHAPSPHSKKEYCQGQIC
jgi:SP family sugar:H+ symporter-like MFS transporter